MKSLTIEIAGQAGCLFEGEIPATYCFVPDNCITAESDGLHLAEGNYLRSGWASRNLLSNDAGEGHYLFPDPRRPVINLEDERVRTFLHRIEMVPAA